MPNGSQAFKVWKKVKKMPHLHLTRNLKRALAATLALLLLAFLAGIPTGAQKKQSGNTATPAPAPKPAKKSIASMRSADATQGSHVTITSDQALNDYSA